MRPTGTLCKNKERAFLVGYGFILLLVVIRYNLFADSAIGHSKLGHGSSGLFMGVTGTDAFLLSTAFC
jgi:hypothetical protein